MLESSSPARKKRTLLLILIALFILLLAFGSYFLYQRFYKPQLSYDSNLPAFAPYVDDTDWYAFSCTVTDLVEKKIQFKTVYSLTVAKCEYKRPDGKDDFVWVPIAVINPQTNQLMIYGSTPNENASILTHFWVKNILQQRTIVSGSRLAIGLNVLSDKNRSLLGVNFVQDSVSDYYTEEDVQKFVQTGDSNFLPKSNVLLPLGIMYPSKP